MNRWIVFEEVCMRIGFGYDVHKLVEARKLILGGVVIEYGKGLAGHSDADVLVHAVMDALLGAAGAGDIGQHFPDTDQQYKDIASLDLLAKVKKILNQYGYVIGNIDTVVVAQAPRLANYMEQMKYNLSVPLEIDEDKINIKATTTEGLGFTGLGEGIAAYAIAMVFPKSNG